MQISIRIAVATVISQLAPLGWAEKFAGDLAFLKKHTEIVLLQDGEAAVAVAPAYQGRVMTSTFDRKAGSSFGWINRPVIDRGLLINYSGTKFQVGIERTVKLVSKQSASKLLDVIAPEFESQKSP